MVVDDGEGNDSTVTWAHDRPDDAPGDEPRVPVEHIGRFTIVGKLGAGGMGVVYAAHDPGLDRKVALKLMKPSPRDRSRDGERRLRLQREAQAMARVSHPNVATVFEVGDFGDQLFVAMELVDGTTLRGWLRERRRGWREIVAMFVAAGRGLEAVHRAGLVHRDFKPDNVLCGSDGRPRVSDFGLVTLEAAAEPNVGGLITHTISNAGTPAYMAPEQLRGVAGDAASDQFAFCVALHEALYDERPFAADAPPEARQAPPRPSKTEVPRWLYTLIARGLAADPAARWPSMTALLDVLGRDRVAARRRWTIGAGVATLLVAAVALPLVRRAQPACPSAEPRLAGVWDDAQRATVRRAFTATGLPFADDTYARVSARLDGYARAFVDMQGESCRATRVDGRQSDTLMDLRAACLERRRAALGALTSLWARGVDAKALERAIDAAGALPPVEECADAKALSAQAPLPTDPIVIDKISAARRRIDGARALWSAERWTEAKAEALAAREEAEATGWAQVRAEAALAVGITRSRLVEHEAEAALTDATTHAATAHDDRLTADAFISLVRHIANRERNPERALLVARLAEGAVGRAGNDDVLRGRLAEARGAALIAEGKYADAKAALLEARTLLSSKVGAADGDLRQIASHLGRIADAEGDYAGARAIFEEEVRLRTELFGAAHPQVASALNNLGAVFDDDGQPEKALEVYRRALGIVERAYGSDGAQIASLLDNIATSLSELGRNDEAAPVYERALAIRERLLGAAHPDLAVTLSNLSGVRVAQGRFDEAVALARRAVAIQEKALGAEHPDLAFCVDALATALMESGDLDEAGRAFEREIAIRKKALGATSVKTAVSEVNLAELRCRQRRYGEAMAIYRRGIEVLAGAPGLERGAETPYRVKLARCQLDAGQAKAALDTLAPVIPLLGAAGENVATRGRAYDAQARALWAVGRRPEALEAARLAERDLTAAQPLTAPDLASFRRWIATRR